jgi:hypothetical protein
MVQGDQIQGRQDSAVRLFTFNAEWAVLKEREKQLSWPFCDHRGA